MAAPTTPAPVPLNSSDIEIATRAANNFQLLFYTTYDSDTRLADLPNFYRSSSSITWNGKPYQGVDGLKELLKTMPSTKHDVQSFDCHPIPGTSPPSLIMTVSGQVQHGPPPPPVDNKARNPDGHPRVFSQTFMLVPDPAAVVAQGTLPVYFISADSLRFVG
ncbi:hypothetical protein DL96DRAFT_1702558 [Flagelloscypha sp. PMI_526]|nr:hypothetical protein DL96DRAFT_1702558 [Flagelloscypha sp. PMI_526]